MSNIEKIKILKVGRKQQPSKFKPGETYTLTTVMDDKNRKLSAFGVWAEKWQENDIIDGIIEEKKWTDKDGFDQISLTIENPNKKPFIPRSGGFGVSPIVTAYQIAASLAPILYAGKKKVMLADIDALAAELKKRIDVTPVIVQDDTQTNAKASTPETTSAPVKEIDVDEEETEEDNEKPF